MVNFMRKRLTVSVSALVALSVTALGSSAALAQQAAAPATSNAAPAVDETIMIIGTRRPGRSVTDSASPIDIIGGSDLAEQPAINLLEAIRNLVPSFYVSQATIADASTFVRAPSLRGLGSDQVLVMINGKRYNRSALVQVFIGADSALSFGAQSADIGNIPAIAIDNLQILRDGATAQYGSDAIGGVLNYQIRRDAGFEGQAIYGQTGEGDGTNKQVAAKWGADLNGRGFITVAGEWFDGEGTSRGATRPAAAEIVRLNPGLANRIPNAPGGPAQIWGSSPSDGWKTFLNAGYDLSEQSSLYLTANVANSQGDQSFNYRPPITVTGLQANNGSATPVSLTNSRNSAFNPIYLTPCPAGNATCPAGGFVNDTNTYSFSSLYPGGFTPRFLGEVDQALVLGGIKGELASGLTYDLSANMSKNSLDLGMSESLSPSFGPQSQTNFNFGKLIQREQVFNADFTYPVEAGLASPVTLSFGAEYREEEYEKTVGDLQSYGAGPYARQPLYNLVEPGVYAAANVVTQSPAASGYGGVSPNFAGTRSQDNYGIYAGAETDLTEKLSAGVAVRFEDYSTFGSTVVGKINALYRATDTLSLRATMGTGFHAPSPGQNNTQIVTTNFQAGNAVQTGTYPVSSEIAKFYGATSLSPEESVNLGIGFVYEPIDNLTLTVDGYSIDVEDRIGISQSFTVTAANLASLPALATVGINGVVNYFTNGFDVRTRGIDAIGTYNTGWLDGDLALSLAYNYNRNEVTDFNPAVINAARRSQIENLAPKDRVVASGSWSKGGWTLNARANYFGSWSDLVSWPSGQRFGGKILTDLDASYTFADQYTLTIGANNLTDEYPDKIAPSASTPIYALTNSLIDGQVYPRSGGPFGMNGRFFYTRLRVTF